MGNVVKHLTVEEKAVAQIPDLQNSFQMFDQ